MAIEEDRNYWINRALAQKEKVGDISKPNWRYENEAKMRDIVKRHSDWIWDFAGNITYRKGHDRINVPYVLDWAKRQAEAGSQVLVIDPVTMISADGDAVWEADENLMDGLQVVAREYKCRILLVTHPKGSSTLDSDGHIKPCMTNMAGGTIIWKASACVIWLKNETGEKQVENATCMGTHSEMVELNRSVHVLKTRDGKPWTRIGMMFEDLNFVEKGVMA
jgi:hypothetical protein